MIDHIAYTVQELHEEDMDDFMDSLGFQPFEVDPDSPQYAYEMEQRQRWYHDDGDCDIHIVENRNEFDMMGWGHICIPARDEDHWAALLDSRFITRENGTGRLWLQAPGGLRVEVRKP